MPTVVVIYKFLPVFSNLLSQGGYLFDMKRILNVLPSRGTEHDWGLATAESAGLVSTSEEVPPAMDLRRKWWKVQNQHKTGACSGFAVAYGLLWWHWVEHLGKPTKEKPSARFAWMASKETDAWTRFPSSMIEGSGTYIKDILRVCHKYGVLTDKRLPMRTPTTSVPEEVLYAEAAKNRIVSYHKLGSLNETRTWIANQGPVICQLSPDRQFMQANRRTKILDKYSKSSAKWGGHAIVLCGYGPGFFLIRNSWGYWWGYQGTQIISEDYAQEAIQETYGITV